MDSVRALEKDDGGLASSQPYRFGAVAIIGPANAGKSTLLNALIGSKLSIVSPKQQTTRNRVLGVKTTATAQFVFLDTPGFMARRYRGELSQLIKRSIAETLTEADLKLLVIDAKKVLHEQSELRRVKAALSEKIKDLPELVVLNKEDLLERNEVLPLLSKVYDFFASWAQSINNQAPEVIPVSALRNQGLNELVNAIEKRLPVGEACFPADFLSDQPEPFLASEIVREQLTLQLNDELPYCLAVVIEGWDEQPELLKINASIIVERDSQKGIVIGENGKKIKSIGQAARIQLEKMFGIKIFIKLFVKVEKNWTGSVRGLSRAGYR